MSDIFFPVSMITQVDLLTIVGVISDKLQWIKQKIIGGYVIIEIPTFRLRALTTTTQQYNTKDSITKGTWVIKPIFITKCIIEKVTNRAIARLSMKGRIFQIASPGRLSMFTHSFRAGGALLISLTVRWLSTSL